MKYQVECYRTAKEYGTFEVEADNRTDAFRKAGEYLNRTLKPVAWNGEVDKEEYGIVDIVLKSGYR